MHFKIIIETHRMIYDVLLSTYVSAANVHEKKYYTLNGYYCR